MLVGTTQKSSVNNSIDLFGRWRDLFSNFGFLRIRNIASHANQVTSIIIARQVQGFLYVPLQIHHRRTSGQHVVIYGTGMCELYFTQVQMIVNDSDQLKDESSKRTITSKS